MVMFATRRAIILLRKNSISTVTTVVIIKIKKMVTFKLWLIQSLLLSLYADNYKLAYFSRLRFIGSSSFLRSLRFLGVTSISSSFSIKSRHSSKLSMVAGVN